MNIPTLRVELERAVRASEALRRDALAAEVERERPSRAEIRERVAEHRFDDATGNGRR